MYGDTKFLLKRETEANKDGYAATQVACKWAGAMIEKDTRIWAGVVSSKTLIGAHKASKEKKKEKRKKESEQVTRGHNIVADGWAGASNPHPNLKPTHKHTSILKARFSAFQLNHHGPTDQRTNRPMDQQIKPLIELRVRN